MFQKIAKHRANDASNDVHRPPLQEHNGDEQQAIDSMMQKLKAKGQEVHMMADTGDSIQLEVTLKRQLNSCLKK